MNGNALVVTFNLSANTSFSYPPLPPGTTTFSSLSEIGSNKILPLSKSLTTVPTGILIISSFPLAPELLDLLPLCPCSAEQGHNGSKSRSSGANGKDEIIKIPVGTVVKDLESGKILFEPISDNEEKVVVPGGKGGYENEVFADKLKVTTSAFPFNLIMGWKESY